MADNKGTRRIYIDLLKIVAMALVFYVHTDVKAMHHYSIAGEKSSYWISMFMFVIATAGPTIFFFISGGLLLGKEESLKDVLLKRVLRYTILLLIFKLIQLIVLLNTNPIYNEIPEYKENFFGTVLKVLYSDTIIEQYWFLHTYLGFILMLPFLRAMVSKLKDEFFIYLIALFVGINEVLMIVEYYWEVPRIDLDMPFFKLGLIVPVIGYYFINRFKDHTKDLKFMIPINVLGWGFIIFDTYYSHVKYVEDGLISSLGATSVIIAIVLYCDIKAICDLNKKDYPKWIVTIISVCASGSLVTFLLDPQIHDWTMPVYEFIEGKINWVGAVICWAICGLTIGILIAWVLRLIPFVGILFGAKPPKKKESK